jgi:hypothetical protein
MRTRFGTRASRLPEVEQRNRNAHTRDRSTSPPPSPRRSLTPAAFENRDARELGLFLERFHSHRIASMSGRLASAASIQRASCFERKRQSGLRAVRLSTSPRSAGTPMSCASSSRASCAIRGEFQQVEVEFGFLRPKRSDVEANPLARIEAFLRDTFDKPRQQVAPTIPATGSVPRTPEPPRTDCAHAHHDVERSVDRVGHGPPKPVVGGPTPSRTRQQRKQTRQMTPLSISSGASETRGKAVRDFEDRVREQPRLLCIRRAHLRTRASSALESRVAEDRAPDRLFTSQHFGRRRWRVDRLVIGREEDRGRRSRRVRDERLRIRFGRRCDASERDDADRCECNASNDDCMDCASLHVTLSTETLGPNARAANRDKSAMPRTARYAHA